MNGQWDWSYQGAGHDSERHPRRALSAARSVARCSVSGGRSSRCRITFAFPGSRSPYTSKALCSRLRKMK